MITAGKTIFYWLVLLQVVFITNSSWGQTDVCVGQQIYIPFEYDEPIFRDTGPVTVSNIVVNGRSMKVGDENNDLKILSASFFLNRDNGSDAFGGWLLGQVFIRWKKVGTYNIEPKFRDFSVNNFSEVVRVNTIEQVSPTASWGSSPTTVQPNSTKAFTFSMSGLNGVRITNYTWRKRYNGRATTLGSGSNKRSHNVTFSGSEIGTHTIEVTVSYNNPCKTLNTTLFKRTVTVCPTGAVALGSQSWSAPTAPIKLGSSNERGLVSLDIGGSTPSGYSIQGSSWTLKRRLSNGTAQTVSASGHTVTRSGTRLSAERSFRGLAYGDYFYSVVVTFTNANCGTCIRSNKKSTLVQTKSQ
ncbi:hypothetical protein [Tunicatimonas pelagia]|uniref:hypothetical protein n=1 Tax=Tunicatimonas pelagia TaxID=931531 RepID=UPI002665DC7E|nr:hypothetical protein [Tunicatimonas pelagia]WKN45335.1 hypothetical protein P0M28_10225 [Tunicatimonas pelagia]